MKPTLAVEPFGTGWRWILDTPDGRFEGNQAYSSPDAAELQGERQLVAYLDNGGKGS